MKRTLLKKSAALLLAVCLAVAAAPSSVFAAKIGDRLGDVLYTDIKAYINNVQIPSYNVNGYLCVKTADLNSYGLTVVYDNASRTSSVSAAYGKAVVGVNVPNAGAGRIGQPVGSYVYTDIVAYVNGQKVDSYNIDGYLVIYFTALKPLGTMVYDDASRTSRMTLNTSTQPTQPVTPTTPPVTLFTLSGVLTADGTADVSSALITLKNSANAIVATNFGNNGTFTFSNLPAGNYTIEASLSGYVTATQAVAVSGSIGNISLKLTRVPAASYTVSGKVTDRDTKAAIYGAYVTLRYAAGAEANRIRTDANGNYSFTVPSVADYSLSVSQSGYADSTTDKFTINGNITKDFALAKNNDFSITGIVTDNSNARITATVRLRASSNNALIDSVRTNARGEYGFYHVAAGSYYLEISADSYSTKTTAQFNVTGDIANYTLNIGAVQNNNYTISGRALDSSGAGFRAKVMLYNSNTNQALSTVYSDNNGYYTFDNVPFGLYYVTVYNTNGDPYYSNDFSPSENSSAYTVPDIRTSGGSSVNNGFRVGVFVENEMNSRVTAEVVMVSDTRTQYTATLTLPAFGQDTAYFYNVPTGRYMVYANVYVNGVDTGATYTYSVFVSADNSRICAVYIAN